jgi:RND superfamily putative drug exporter
VFARLGSWCFRRRWVVVAAWVVGAIVFGATSGAMGGAFGQDFTPSGFESTNGLDVLEEETGGFGAGIPGSIVFRAEQGVDDPEVEARMTELFTTVQAIAEDPDVDLDTFEWLDDEQRAALEAADLEAWEGATLTSPYGSTAEPQIATEGPDAGKIAFASLEVPGTDWADAYPIAEPLQALFPDVEGLQVELGGAAFAEFEEPESEALGLAFAIVILVVAFGSVLAMGLPIGVALAGIIVGSMIATILSNTILMPDFAVFLGVMIGLGVGIDYALFIVTRYRENLHHGHSPDEATAIAIDTAGRAVTFAGITVVISFMGMIVMGIQFISGLAISAAVVVLMTVVASLTLLPALLGFAGERVEVSRWRGVIATGFVALGLVGAGLHIDVLASIGFPMALLVLLLGLVLKPLQREVPKRRPRPVRDTYAYRWSRLVQHHPWAAAAVGTAILVILALPVLGMRLGFSDESQYHEDTTTRQAYDLLSDGFGPGYNGPFYLVAQVDEEADPEVLEQITADLAADPGVAFVTPAVANTLIAPDRDLGAYLWKLTPTTSPQDEDTYALVHRLRDEVLVEGEEALGTNIDVTGQLPATVDFSGYMSERMPYFFAAVLVLSFLLLMVVFRSILVPLKAVIMNLLSIGAAYGVTVALVQWAWFGDVTGLSPSPIETFIPMMFFAIVFGLSMDYEVFLLSRVKEEWRRTGDSHLSVANGLATTARVITAAAAIMVVVFGSFILENDRNFKMFGIGLATAIFLDATVVRMLLVPATMELLGDRNWWLPRWLDRILPRIDIEGTPDDVSEIDADDPDADPEPERELVTV